MHGINKHALAAIALVASLQALSAAAQNRVANSQLDASTAGWTKLATTGSATLTFDASRDANSSSQSGSAAYANRARPSS